MRFSGMQTLRMQTLGMQALGMQTLGVLEGSSPPVSSGTFHLFAKSVDGELQLWVCSRYVLEDAFGSCTGA